MLVYYMARLHSNYEETIAKEVYDVETGQRKMVEVPNDQSYQELDTQVR